MLSVNGILATTDCNDSSTARGVGYYTDRYSFIVDNIAVQDVYIILTSTAFDTYLYLRNPSGTVIAYDDDGGGGPTRGYRPPAPVPFICLP